ncbi:hypothetical protein BA893_07095 [Vibrio natriegens]|uniref:hypothetical protein n=1 Tax=Vibrio natriegens TaxID=691 RepID=UPI0008042162|nr:hypothetical protein [Vibrio natriegens]ANQ21446.1 hypothetical protein BA893_07095 [Vibrio natriegens]
MNKSFVFGAAIFLAACNSGNGSNSGGESPNTGVEPKPPEPLNESQLVINVDKNNVQFYSKGDDRFSDRYLEYNLKHIEDPSINADLWRLYELYESENTSSIAPYSFSRVNDGKPIANAGEWEAAIREVGAGDFIGGYHGDELLNSVTLTINGVEVPLDESQYVADSFTFSQVSDMYSWHTGEIVATHVKEYNFSQSGFILKQKIEWKESIELSRAYLSMLPVKRKIDSTSGFQVTDTAWYWPSGYVQDVSESGFPVSVTNTDDEVWLEGAESRFRAELKMTEHPQLPGYNVFVVNSDAYNKIYFDISKQYTTRVGEVWETSTNYNLTTYN